MLHVYPPLKSLMLFTYVANLLIVRKFIFIVAHVFTKRKKENSIFHDFFIKNLILWQMSKNGSLFMNIISSF